MKPITVNGLLGDNIYINPAHIVAFYDEKLPNDHPLRDKIESNTCRIHMVNGDFFYVQETADGLDTKLASWRVQEARA